MPLCCIFDETEYEGNVFCRGKGRDNLPGSWQKQAKSARCFSGAQMLVSGGTLDDFDPVPGMVQQEPDLKNIIYGRDGGTYSSRVKAIHIYVA